MNTLQYLRKKNLEIDFCYILNALSLTVINLFFKKKPTPPFCTLVFSSQHSQQVFFILSFFISSVCPVALTHFYCCFY